MSGGWSRRELLVLGLGLAGTGLAGCTTPPAAPGSPRPSPTATGSGPSASASPSAGPTPTGATAAAAVEASLASLSGAVLTGRQKGDLSRAQRSLLTFARAGHQAHAAALAGGTPPTVPGGTPGSGASLKKQLALLARREAAAQKRWQRAAVAAEGADAVLWGSMAVAAEALASALGSASPPGVTPVRVRAEVVLLSDVGAVQEMVRQLHAVVYGYQMALGRLPVAGRRLPRAVAELRAHRVLREDLIDWLTARSARVPVPEAAYVPPVVPVDEETAVQLLRRMQDALQPFCGLWLAAAADEGQRRRALTALGNAARTARGWGGRVTAWPGYVTG